MQSIPDYKSLNKAQEKLEKQEEIRLRSDVRTVFGTSEGKRVLFHILSMCKVYDDCFTGNSQTYYFEGKRAVGLELLELVLDTDKEIYIDIIRGNKTNG